jgi:hypothetical protein
MAGSLDTIHVLKIYPQDQRAVIKTPDGRGQTIKRGDSLKNDTTLPRFSIDFSRPEG